MVGFTFIVNAQQDSLWKREGQKIEYKKHKRYKGPKDWYASSPAEMNKYEADDNYGKWSQTQPGSNNNPIGSQSYTQEEIDQEREKRYGKDYNGGGGNVHEDPEIIKPDPIEFPELDAPDIDAPDIDLPDVSAPDFLSSQNFWKILLFIVLFAIAIWIVYMVVKNRQPSNKKVVQDVEDEWNPVIIPKSELEQRLENAERIGDYRECVRIYFMFILKELGKKGWIRWRSEKTNYDYLLEMRSKNNYVKFEEVVRVYDLVWYGDYNIDKSIYQLLQPTLTDYYQSLDPTNE